METTRAERKMRIGRVVSDKMDKTRTVAVEWASEHPVYRRRVRRVTMFRAHDEENASKQGDMVRLIETRPLSKTKRWRIAEVLVKSEVVEVRPEEVDQTLLKELQAKPEKPEVVEQPVAEQTAAEGSNEAEGKASTEESSEEPKS